MKAIFCAMGNQIKAGVAILISAKVVFKPKLIRKGKESYYIFVKRTIQQEEITSINKNALNTSVPNFIKLSLLDIKD